jgi:deoxyribodipyrimidine photolyase-related protein
MRHFAQELTAAGWQVTYEIADDFETPLKKWVRQNGITELQVMSPADRPFAHLIENLNLGCQITLVPNNHFLWSQDEFEGWAKSRKRLLMEDFYRTGRKRFDILMKGDKPVGVNGTLINKIANRPRRI